MYFDAGLKFTDNLDTIVRYKTRVEISLFDEKILRGKLFYYLSPYTP